MTSEPGPAASWTQFVSISSRCCCDQKPLPGPPPSLWYVPPVHCTSLILNGGFFSAETGSRSFFSARSFSTSLRQCPTNSCEHTEHAQCFLLFLLLTSTDKTTQISKCFQGSQQTSGGTMVFARVLRTCSGVTLAGLVLWEHVLNCRHPSRPHRHLSGRPPPPLSLLPRFLFFAPPPDPPLPPSGVTWTPSCTCLAAGCSMQLRSVESPVTPVSLTPRTAHTVLDMTGACCFCEADKRPHEQLFPAHCDVRQVGGRTS